MDCNKEEAIRAMDIAEKKMEGKDFTGARKFALKAQQLYPDVGNISQMLMVCDVHCAAEKRLFGNEMDWYGILQIEQTANEATIKKQYKKYALLLHPDKNKYIGAEAAFKLIGEAQRVLLDQEKRRLHDMRRKPAVSYRPPQRASSTFNIGVQNSFCSNFTSFNPQHQQPQQHGQSGFVHNRATFWTVCPFCSVRYQYYKEVVNRSLCCQNCKKPFVAYDMEVQGAQPMTNLNQTSFFQQQNSFNQGPHRAEVRCQGNSQSEKPRTESGRKTRNSSEAASEKFYAKKRRKQTSESSESCETGSSSDFEENIVTNEDGDIHSRTDVGCTREHHPRRSSRHKPKVSYNENLSDNGDDFVITPKKSKRSKSTRTSDELSEGADKDEAADVDDDWRKIKQKEKDCSEGSLLSRNKKTKKVSHKETADGDDYQRSMESPGDPEFDSAFEKTSESNLFHCREPDFYNFDKLRDQECFALGQIWAMYDNIDTMPRFYAWIKKVFSSRFKVQITWLEPEPNDDDRSKCVDKKLPVSCGEFVFGSTETMEDCDSMFSHKISWEKGSRRDTFKIYPRKGEIWALFRNWDKNWSCDSSCQFEYEVVEVLSDYTEEEGIDVALLGKVKGFSSLFCRMVKKGETSFQVPAVELFRFSHQVPSYQLTGEEREDVPKGSFELDSAALPSNLPEIAIPEVLKEEATDIGVNGLFVGPSNMLKSMMESKGNAATQKADIKSCFQSGGMDGNAHVASPLEAFEIPEAEFWNFDAEKSYEKFQIGQIWALYSDEDGLPRYYGQIKKIAYEPEFEMQLTWLESCALPSNAIKWHDKGMPISCGRFGPKRGKLCMSSYTSVGSFSHLVRAVPAAKNGFFISPKKGEVWALYRNWPEIRYSDLDKCEYDIVEVIEDDDLQTEVLVLERVNGFNSVFKAQTKGASTHVMQIPEVELLRFSHQIPAFRLTEERNGSLRGFWELDPFALPIHYFS